MFDFPAAPSVGQKYPVSPGAGVPQYTWNGVTWTTRPQTPAGSGKVPVYSDGSTAMAAQLTLFGDPVAATDAADKHYVDMAAAAIGPPAGSVRYDAAQSLSGAEQARSQSNIGLTSGVPAGTVMLFYSAAAPVGWTQVTTHNDKTLRVVSGAGGAAGGTNAFSTVMAQTVTGNHTLSRAELAAGINSSGSTTNNIYLGGNSAYYAPYCTSGWGFSQWPAPTSSADYVPYNTAGSFGYSSYASGTITTTVTSSNTGGTQHNHPVTMQMQYCDVIIASKN